MTCNTGKAYILSVPVLPFNPFPSVLLVYQKHVTELILLLIIIIIIIIIIIKIIHHIYIAFFTVLKDA